MQDRNVIFTIIPDELTDRQCYDLLVIRDYYNKQGMKITLPVDGITSTEKDIVFKGDLQTAIHFSNSLGLKMIPVLCKSVEDDNFVMMPNVRRFNHFSIYKNHKNA